MPVWGTLLPPCWIEHGVGGAATPCVPGRSPPPSRPPPWPSPAPPQQSGLLRLSGGSRGPPPPRSSLVQPGDRRDSVTPLVQKGRPPASRGLAHSQSLQWGSGSGSGPHPSWSFNVPGRCAGTRPCSGLWDSLSPRGPEESSRDLVDDVILFTHYSLLDKRSLLIACAITIK